MERYILRIKIRFVSLFIDRLFFVSFFKERNGRNMGNVNLDKFCKNFVFEGVNRKDIVIIVCFKFNGFD